MFVHAFNCFTCVCLTQWAWSLIYIPLLFTEPRKYFVLEVTENGPKMRESIDDDVTTGNCHIHVNQETFPVDFNPIVC